MFVAWRAGEERYHAVRVTVTRIMTCRGVPQQLRVPSGSGRAGTGSIVSAAIATDDDTAQV